MKLGLAAAFARFDAYQLAKYDRDGPIKLRNVLFLVHAKPADEVQGALWKQVAERSLPAPDTWEVSRSGGADKRATFERLLAERKLGYLALLRNLRNMDEASVDEALVKDAILARRGAERVLPFRYVAAARAAPRFEPWLDQALSEAVLAAPVLGGAIADKRLNHRRLTMIDATNVRAPDRKAWVERKPLWTDKRHDRGPFDIIGDVHGCAAEREDLLHRLGYQVAWRESRGERRVAVADRLAATGQAVIAPTRCRRVELASNEACAAAAAWWEDMIAGGGEGMVVKPLDFVSRGPKGLFQLALKVRGRDCLRIIYGPEYDAPEHLARLRERGLTGKRNLALKEFALGHEA